MEYKEIWLDVVGFEGYYQVSNLGRVRSFPRKGTRKQTVYLKASRNKYGYRSVHLKANGIRKTMTVHRIEATAFIPNPDRLETINHIDGNKLNNNLNNLEWMSRYDNSMHAVQIGIHKHGEGHGKAVLTETNVLFIRKYRHKLTRQHLADKFGVTKSLIEKIWYRQLWKHI